MTKDEALKMAIDTLQNARRKHFYCEDTYYSCPKHEDGCADDRQPDECNCGADKLNSKIDIAINACKEALEQPSNMVAWIYQNNSGYPSLRWNDKNTFNYDSIARKQPDIPLYTHPHQWQGLTDDEIDKIIKEKDGVFGAVVRAVEQALKDKNTCS